MQTKELIKEISKHEDKLIEFVEKCKQYENEPVLSLFEKVFLGDSFEKTNLKEEMSKRFVRDIRDLTKEDASWVNEAIQKDLAEYAKQHEKVFLGKDTRKERDAGEPYLVEYEGIKTSNQEYDFAVPCQDSKLLEMLELKAQYDLKGRYIPVNIICDKVLDLGGILLIWQEDE